MVDVCIVFFFSSRRRHTRFDCDWSSDVCSSDLFMTVQYAPARGMSGTRARRAPGDPPHSQRTRSAGVTRPLDRASRSEEHTSELQSQSNLVCRLLLEKKNLSRDANVVQMPHCTA